MKKCSIQICLLFFTLLWCSVSSSSAAPRLDVYPNGSVGGLTTHMAALAISNDFPLSPFVRDQFSSSYLIAPFLSLSAAHSFRAASGGWVENHKLMRMNHGSVFYYTRDRPVRWGSRYPASGTFMRRSYRIARPGSLEDFNSDFAISYKVPFADPFVRAFMRLKVADPHGSYPHTLFRERPNSWQEVRSTARSRTNTKEIVCYPMGYYRGFRHDDEWKLHYRISRMQFTRRAPGTRDANGMQNAWFRSDAVKTGGGCSGGGLISHESGRERYKLLGTVITTSRDHPVGVRLADTKVLRMARAVNDFLNL